MPPFSRGQATFAAGQRLIELSHKLRSLSTDLEVRAKQINEIPIAAHAIIQELDRVRESARSAKGMYPNYPRLRKAILDAGEEVSYIRDELWGAMAFTVPEELADTFLTLGTKLKLISFAPSPSEERNATTSVTDPEDTLD